MTVLTERSAGHWDKVDNQCQKVTLHSGVDTTLQLSQGGP